MLQENSQWTDVGPSVHPLLNPPRRIRIPTLGAYVLHKGVTSATRGMSNKRAKDLVYVYEITRDPVLGPLAVDGVRALAARHPDQYALWRERLQAVVRSLTLRREMAEQLVVAGGALGLTEVVEAQIAARFAQTLDETALPRAG